MPTDIEGGWDAQDLAEVFDEDNLSLDGAGDASADMMTLEEMPDVIDVTSAVGDADDDAALIGEELDDDEIIALAIDGDATDIEDDDLAERMPEAFDDDAIQVMISRSFLSMARWVWTCAISTISATGLSLVNSPRLARPMVTRR
jgi:hypothetical protein